MSQKHCCVPRCKESGESHPVLHVFPNPKKYPDRFRSWVNAVGGDIVGLSNDYIYSNRRVCHRHFEEQHHCRNNKLSTLAVPRKYLPDLTVIPQFNLSVRKGISVIKNIEDMPSTSCGEQYELFSELKKCRSATSDKIDIKENIEQKMAMATATATTESSQTLIQTETHVQKSYQEVQVSQNGEHRQLTEQHQVTEKVKKKKSMRRHNKEEGTISVSKSSEKLFKKTKAAHEVNSNPYCEKCQRPVYAIKRTKPERRIWHKECFRCVQCNKQLTVETYQSDHTILYCKPHFKQLFEPKRVDDEDETDATPRKPQMIICESNPFEPPPDVVRRHSYHVEHQYAKRVHYDHNYYCEQPVRESQHQKNLEPTVGDHLSDHSYFLPIVPQDSIEGSATVVVGGVKMSTRNCEIWPGMRPKVRKER